MNPFGTGLFGQNKPATSGFGQFGSGGFGQTANAFGQAAQTQPTNAFGQAAQTQPTNAFGQPAQTQQPTTTGFGQTSGFSGFGATNTANPFGARPATGGFGTAATATTTTAPSAFGQPTQQQQQQPQQANTLGGFGQQNTNTSGFGLNSSTNAFGQPNTTNAGFGQTNNASGFNQTAQQGTTGFGQTSTASSTGTGFGTGLFGQNKPATSGFGQFGSGGFGQTANAFGQAAQTQPTNAFGQAAQTQPTNAFGQPAQTQQPTTTGFGQTSGFSGFGATNTANPFGARPATGGFGTAAAATTTTAPSAFGQPTQQQQQQPQQANTLGGFGQQTTLNVAPLPSANPSFMALPDYGENPYGKVLLFATEDQKSLKPIADKVWEKESVINCIKLPTPLPLPQFSRSSTSLSSSSWSKAKTFSRLPETLFDEARSLELPACSIPVSALRDILQPTLTLGENLKAAKEIDHCIEHDTANKQHTNAVDLNRNEPIANFKEHHLEELQEEEEENLAQHKGNNSNSSIKHSLEQAQTEADAPDASHVSAISQSYYPRYSPKVTNALAPTCSTSEYDIYPPLSELALLSAEALEHVEHFSVWRCDSKCGITFIEPVNLKQTELTDVIELCKNGMVTLYPHGDVPPRKCGLNVCAEVTVNRVINISESSLKEMCEENGYKFISYVDNVWRYRINEDDNINEISHDEMYHVDDQEAENVAEEDLREKEEREQHNAHIYRNSAENKNDKIINQSGVEQYEEQFDTSSYSNENENKSLDESDDVENEEKMSIYHDDNNTLFSLDNSPSSHRSKRTQSRLSSAHRDQNVTTENTFNTTDSIESSMLENHTSHLRNRNKHHAALMATSNGNSGTHSSTRARSAHEKQLFDFVPPHTLMNHPWRVSNKADNFSEPPHISENTISTPTSNALTTLPYAIPDAREIEAWQAHKKVIAHAESHAIPVPTPIPVTVQQINQTIKPTYYFAANNSLVQREFVEKKSATDALTLHGALARSFRVGCSITSQLSFPCYAALRDDMEVHTYMHEVPGAQITLTKLCPEHASQSYLTRCAVQLLQVLQSFVVCTSSSNEKNVSSNNNNKSSNSTCTVPLVRVVLRRKDRNDKANTDINDNLDNNNDHYRNNNEGTLSEEQWCQIQSCVLNTPTPSSPSRSEQDVRRQFNSVTSLIKALYTLPECDISFPNAVEEAQYMCQLRRRTLREWLSNELASLTLLHSTTATENTKHDSKHYGQELVQLLLCHKLKKARSFAEESGNDELARVIDVCGGGRNLGLLAAMTPPLNFAEGNAVRELVVSLLSGNVYPFITEDEYEEPVEPIDNNNNSSSSSNNNNGTEISKEADRSVSQVENTKTPSSPNKLINPVPHAATWKQVLGIFVFFGCNPNTSAQDVIQSFIERFNAPEARRGKAYPPYAERLPTSVLHTRRGANRVERGSLFKDACFSLLEAFSLSSAPAANCLHPHASSYYANDYLIPFIILCAIREIGVERSRPYKDAETSALVGFAAQLECNEIAWHWALLVLHMVDNDVGRVNAVRCFCKRNAYRVHELQTRHAESQQLRELTQIVNLCNIDCRWFAVVEPPIEENVQVERNAPSLRTHAVLQNALQQLSMLS